MCESSVYLRGAEGSSELVMKDVVRVRLQGDELVCEGVLGERRTIPRARIVEADLVGHEIVVVSAQR